MSKYVRSSSETFEFDDERVNVTLKPIEFPDVLRFNAIDMQAADAELSASNLMAEVLPKYIESMDLKDAGGNPVSVEELCAKAYFVPLVNAIGVRLIQRGSPPNPKKPAAPSAS